VIVIAHRLSTIKAADQIAVVSKGRVLQVGTHESLLEDVGGVYWRLVNAQRLYMSTHRPGEDEVSREEIANRLSSLIGKESYDTLAASEYTAVASEYTTTTDLKMPHEVCAQGHSPSRTPIPSQLDQDLTQSIFASFGMLLLEQKRNWLGYFIMLLAAAGAGCKSLDSRMSWIIADYFEIASSAIQAYLFARLISGFAYWGKQLVSSTSFLCLMLLTVAVGVGLSYFTLSWVSNSLSAVSITTLVHKTSLLIIVSVLWLLIARNTSITLSPSVQASLTTPITRLAYSRPELQRTPRNYSSCLVLIWLW
jgi:ATP-binding cassette subfamily B (MDR/TAP) protein 1